MDRFLLSLGRILKSMKTSITWGAMVLAGLVFGFSPRSWADPKPYLCAVSWSEAGLRVEVRIPQGFQYAVLEGSRALGGGDWEPLISGAVKADGEGLATFVLDGSGAWRVFRVRAGLGEEVPPAMQAGEYSVVYRDGQGLFPGADDGSHLDGEERVGHVLNRLAYGPNAVDTRWVDQVGIPAYIEAQLSPAGIDETVGSLPDREDELFETYVPADEKVLIRAGETWRYFKGTQAPPNPWRSLDFDDSEWLSGPTGIGYGDGDDATVLRDMRKLDATADAPAQPGYLTVYLRKTFFVAAPGSIEQLVARIDYDDGFVAYLNGVEVARSHVTGMEPRYDQAAATPDHEAGDPEEFDLTRFKQFLRTGQNVWAIELHNVSLTSSDASMIPELIQRTPLDVPPLRRIRDVQALQQLVHVRGTYARRQLQAVLGEFWQNHFTTDYDKVETYFDDLSNSDGSDAMPPSQAHEEAAQAKYREYQFFCDHALGNFGDLLLYSATSPAQLIYLDNVLNVKGEPNENYAREIMELFAFGVDNRYTQTDIEQLAKCFTGWSIRKAWPDQVQDYPNSSRQPPTDNGVKAEDRVIVEDGGGWRYFKGLSEPSPTPGGEPGLAWTTPGFDDSAWAIGATSIGYGDDDDATVLTDMRGRYASVYLRRTFGVADLSEIQNLLLEVRYDDGFIAYLNGTEVARSRTMREAGSPPAHNTTSPAGHEVEAEPDRFNLESYLGLLRPAPQVNVLAIQVHNVSLTSSDLSIHPRLLDRRQLPGSIENGAPGGVWVFRFNPDEHDTGAKTLFAGTPQEIAIPAGRTGLDGLKDAVEVIDAMASHPSTAEFICLKLINRFVSDAITLESYRDGTAPAGLRGLMDQALAAWHETQPQGNIAHVLGTIFDPIHQKSYFWDDHAYRSKLKTPVEFIISTLRALGADVSGDALPGYEDRQGMNLFTRDDPDGWSELGIDWMGTSTLLERIKFSQTLAANRDSKMRWDPAALAAAQKWATADDVINYFDRTLFQNTLTGAERDLLRQFLTTDDAGQPRPFEPQRADFIPRLEVFAGLVLSMPSWQYQ